MIEQKLHLAVYEALRGSGAVRLAEVDIECFEVRWWNDAEVLAMRDDTPVVLDPTGVARIFSAIRIYATTSESSSTNGMLVSLACPVSRPGLLRVCQGQPSLNPGDSRAYKAPPPREPQASYRNPMKVTQFFLAEPGEDDAPLWAKTAIEFGTRLFYDWRPLALVTEEWCARMRDLK